MTASILISSYKSKRIAAFVKCNNEKDMRELSDEKYDSTLKSIVKSLGDNIKKIKSNKDYMEISNYGKVPFTFDILSGTSTKEAAKILEDAVKSGMGDIKVSSVVIGKL